MIKIPKIDRIKKFLLTINDPYRSQALKIYEKYYHKFRQAPASKSYHNAYPGGLYDHTLNVMICIKEFNFPAQRLREYFQIPLKFNYDKAIFVGFIHDIGKIYEYSNKPYKHHTVWIFEMLKECEIEVDDEIVNAIYNHHGGYSGRRDKLGPLAIILHTADMFASQVIEE